MIKLAGAPEESVFSQVGRRGGAEGKAGAAAPTAAWTGPVGTAPCDPNGLGRRPSAPRPSRARPRLHLARDQFGTRRCSTGSGEERRIPYRCHPSSPSVASPRPALRPASRERAGPRVCPRAGGRWRSLWAPGVAGDSVCAFWDPGCLVGAFGRSALGRDRRGGRATGSLVRQSSVPLGCPEVRGSSLPEGPPAQAGGPQVEGLRPEDGPAETTPRRAE